MGCVNAGKNQKVSKTETSLNKNKPYYQLGLDGSHQDTDVSKFTIEAKIYKKTSKISEKKHLCDEDGEEEDIRATKTQGIKQSTVKNPNSLKNRKPSLTIIPPKQTQILQKNKQNSILSSSDPKLQTSQTLQTQPQTTKSLTSNSKLDTYKSKIPLPIVLELSQEYVESRVLAKSGVNRSTGVKNQEMQMRA